jgi:hypothetical protein
LTKDLNSNIPENIRGLPLRRSTLTNHTNENETVERRTRRTQTFLRDVITSTHFLKNGTGPASSGSLDFRTFADQKAKALNLSAYSFPVFIIRRPKQRSSYSIKGEGDAISPSPGDHVHP